MLIEQFYSSFIHLNSTDLNLVNISLFIFKVNLYSIHSSPLQRIGQRGSS
jgi:hypothetical protein